jgi:hypothetical protein
MGVTVVPLGHPGIGVAQSWNESTGQREASTDVGLHHLVHECRQAVRTRAQSRHRVEVGHIARAVDVEQLGSADQWRWPKPVPVEEQAEAQASQGTAPVGAERTDSDRFGTATVETRGRGEAATWWVARLKGNKMLSLVQ